VFGRDRQRSPELAAGGFRRNDHQVLFYTRVRALLGDASRVLDFGAGRGKFTERYLAQGDQFRADLIDLRTAGATVVGCDVDPVVRENPILDEAVVIDPAGRLPFPDASFDLVVAWAVLEHVVEPERWAHELARVLRPGGWICAWTPQRWGMVGVGGRLVPNRYHSAVLTSVLRKRERGEVDIFPTAYRMNTQADLERLFPTDRFLHATYPFNGPVGYVDGIPLGRTVARAYASLPGGATASYLHVFIQKRRQTGSVPSRPSDQP
jgi:SAM-dependent methyltransferase